MSIFRQSVELTATTKRKYPKDEIDSKARYETERREVLLDVIGQHGVHVRWAQFQLPCGSIEYTELFKDLGVQLTSSLSDSTDVDAKLLRGYSIFKSLSKVFCSTSLPVKLSSIILFHQSVALIMTTKRKCLKDKIHSKMFLNNCQCVFFSQKYCVDDMETPESIFSCLRRNKDEDDFDRRCMKMIVLREELRAQGWLVNEMITLLIRL